MSLNAVDRAALRAIAEGRTPAEDLVRARLKREGLISRGVLGDHRLMLTAAGRAALEPDA